MRHFLLIAVLLVAGFCTLPPAQAQGRALLAAPPESDSKTLPQKPLSQNPADTPPVTPPEEPSLYVPQEVLPRAEIPAPESLAPALPEEIFQSLPKDMQEELLAEAERYYNTCLNSGTYASYHDCRCLGGKYLDKRLELGPKADEYTVSSKIESECVDKVSIAGFSYEKCTRMFVYAHLSNLKQFCACFANKVAEMYAKDPGPNLDYMSELELQASRECRVLDGGAAPPLR